MEKKKMKFSKKILLILAVIIILIVIAFVSYKIYLRIDMDMRFKEFEKRQAIETKGVLVSTKEDKYAKVVNMDYITQDGIGVRVDSLMMTDDTLNARIQFKFEQDINFQTLGYGFVIYDENKNIYCVSSRMHIGEKEKYDYNYIFIYRELGIYNNMGDARLVDSTSLVNESIDVTEKTIMSNLKLEAIDKFPQSKKLYIKLFDLGYYNANKDENGKIIAQNFNLSDAKWLFELDIPEELNERNTINLTIDSKIPKLDIINATITETKLVLNFNSEEYINLINAGKDMPSEEFFNKCKEMLNITDGEGKIYQDIGGGTTKNNGYKISFNATKKDLPKKLFINFKVGDTQYRSELIEK